MTHSYDPLDTPSQVKITIFTDPYCTWCWGSEPTLGKIRETYHDQVSFQNVMGGLVKDVAQFHDPANNIGGDQVFEQVAAHWKDASSRHRMPVDERVFFDTKGTYRSTHPACIAVKAAEFQGHNQGSRYLRRLREAVETERRGIHAETIQIELAEETGLDVNQFKADLASGKAHKAFQKDLNLCREHGVRGFPAYLLQAADGRNHAEWLCDLRRI